MSVDRRTVLLGLLASTSGAASGAHAQGFAGLGTTAEGFALPVRGSVPSFPEDHAAHPAYRIEWWYLTATLQGADGLDYGVQWTLFRSALAPTEADGWQSPQLWMGHVGLTTPDWHHHGERLARGGIDQAGVKLSPFVAWIDDWIMASTAPEGADPLDRLRLTASGWDFNYELFLTAEGPLVLHGDRGYSVKSPAGQASYYYSQPFYRVEGTLHLAEGKVPVTGQGWLDREWSSQPLAENQTGWDWFSLSFDAGPKLMAFRLRDNGPGFTSGTWILPDGQSTALPDGKVRMTPMGEVEVAGRQVPVRWRLELADEGVDVTIEALNAQSWMATSVPYWEGPVIVTGSHPGRGYLEMTGYE